jgi:hypothetical protein
MPIRNSENTACPEEYSFPVLFNLGIYNLTAAVTCVCRVRDVYFAADVTVYYNMNTVTPK